MKNKTLLIIAIIFGLISALLVYNYLSDIEATQQTRFVDVVVANVKIPTNTQIKASMLAWKQVPVDALHPDAAQNFQDIQGRITNSEIIPGEQVLWSRLFPKGQVPSMSFTIPNDKRGITIAVNEVIGVAGFVKPGDTVDILATFAADIPYTTTVLENVTVLAISQEMVPKQNPTAQLGTSVTFALSPQQVERLVLAESQGAIRLALRSPQAIGIASRQGTSMSEIQPLAYSNREDLKGQEVVTRPPVTSVTSFLTSVESKTQSEVQLKDNEKKIEIEVIKGSKQEVQVIYE